MKYRITAGWQELAPPYKAPGGQFPRRYWDIEISEGDARPQKRLTIHYSHLTGQFTAQVSDESEKTA